MYKVNTKRLVATVLSAVLLVGSLTACGSTVDATLADENLILPTQTNYKTTTATMGTYQSKVYSTAQALYSVNKDLYYDGAVIFESFLVEKGDAVQKGDKLASFTVESSAVPLEEKELEYKRTQNAFDRGKESRQSAIQDGKTARAQLTKGTTEYKIKSLEIEKDQIAYDQYVFSTKAQLDSLSKQIATLKEQMETKYLVAPFAGTVGKVESIKQGDKIDPSVLVMNLYATDRVMLKIDNNNGFRYYDTVEIEARIAMQAMTYTGIVVSNPAILPPTLGSSGTYVLLTDVQSGASLEEVETMVQSAVSGVGGYSVRDFDNVIISADSVYMPNVLVVDAKAVTTVNAKSYVSILEDDTLKKRYLTSTNFNKDQFWVLDGLTEGQTVIVE